MTPLPSVEAPQVERPPTAPAAQLVARLSPADHVATSRMVGLDVARALAIFGMLAVHVGPTAQGDLAGRLYALPHGRASLLFMLLAGIGVSLLARSSRTSTAQTRGKLAWRAALLLPLGLGLQLLDHGAFVILQEYALLFLLATAAIAASDRVLLASAAAVATIGPVVHLLGQMRAPATFERDGMAATDSIGEVAHGLVLSGPFPLITWLAPFLLGLWLGRRNLRSAEVRARLIAGGATAAVGSFALSVALVRVFGDPMPPADWTHLIARSAHSQMPLWLIGGTGLAAVVVGLCLVAADHAPRLLWPLAATGQLALTVYVGHLVALHLAPDALTADGVAAATAIVAAVSVTAIVLATLWRAAASRGPLEAALQLPWWAARQARRSTA